jgi:hypothetical protein
MKKLFVLSLACLPLCGCLSTNFTEYAKAMAGDPATIVVSINTVYGTAKFTRVGETTNSANVMKTVSPDGTVTIK